MQEKLSNYNNKLNSHHNNDEEDLQDSLYGISEITYEYKQENTNIVQEQEDSDISFSIDPNIINQDREIIINKVAQPMKINKFSQQKKCKKLDLYNQPKIDNAFKKVLFIRSRFDKKQKSNRAKMNTKKLNDL